MGIISYFENKAVDRLRRRLTVLEQKYQFNAYRVYVPTNLLSNDKINRTIVESLVWYSGDVEALMDMYKTNTERYSQMRGCFWEIVGDNDRKVHSGLPNLIVSKMPTIIYGSGYNIDCVVYKDDGSIDEEASDKANTRKEVLFEQLDVHNKLMASEEKASWSGHLASKISIDTSISDYPIWELYDRRYFEIIQERGITQGIVFKSYHERGESKYLVKEYYTTNKDGFAVIQNSLWKYNVAKSANEQLPFSAIQMCLGLSDEEVPQEEVVLPIKGMLAHEMPNVIAKSIINENPYGRSDIMAFSSYDSLDEIVSQIVSEIRENQTIRYIPESMIPKDDNGEFMRMRRKINNFIKVVGDKDQNGENKVETTQIPDKTLQHIEKYNVLIANVCNQSELSPLSLGITGLESLSSSDKSTRERSKTTLEMRNKKVVLRKAFIKKVMTQLLIVDDYMQVNKMGIDYNNLDINVSFNDYIGSSQEERILMWSGAKTSGVSSIDNAVRKIHAGDKTEEEMLEEINQIRFDSGLAIDSPDALNPIVEEKVDEDVEEVGGVSAT